MQNETNPIEQRIERLTDKWKDAIDIREGRIIRLHYKEEEEEIIDAFLWYMLGIDSLIDDVAFILDPLFSDIDEYSDGLLHELSSLIKEWNGTEPAPDVDYRSVDWTPDPTLKDKKNPATLFVENFNRLAEVLDLQEGRFVVAILDLPHEPEEKKNVEKWLRYALKAGISPRVKYLIRNTEENPRFRNLAGDFPETCLTIIPEMDMKSIISQVASMGDPSDPSTLYRVAFVGMLTAMGKNDRKETEQKAKECMAIARANEEYSPEWKIQQVVVRLALGNDRVRYKEYDKAMELAGEAIEIASALPEALGEAMGKPVLAQAYMASGSYACYPKKWNKAIPGFTEAARLYREADNPIMAMEAYRMAGFCANKEGLYNEIVPPLVAGFREAARISPETLRSTSFSALLRQLTDKNYTEYLSPEEVSDLAATVYGEEWQKEIRAIWKKSPDAREFWQEEEEQDIPQVG